MNLFFDIGYFAKNKYPAAGNAHDSQGEYNQT
jgi:hypothetical protein